MTMTLGFDVRGYLEATFDEAVATAVIAALASHAPVTPLRVAAYGRDGFAVIELGADGTPSLPSDIAAIVTAIETASFVDWSNDEAPSLAPIIVPGGDWDIATLLADPAVKNQPDVAYVLADAIGTDRARQILDERCAELLDVAERHRIVLVFR